MPPQPQPPPPALLCVWASRIGDFELDWVRELLPADTEYIDEDVKVRDYPNTPCIYIANYWHDSVKQLENVRHDFGIIYLGEEILSTRIDYFLDNPLCKFVWRNYIHPKYIEDPRVTFFPCAYKKGFRDANADSIAVGTAKIYTWSFAGAIHHHEREMAINTFKEAFPDSYKVHTTPPGSFNASEGLATSEYRALIRDSKYIICPPGKLTMECSRLYEALEAGAVPIVVANTAMMTFKCSPSYHHFVFPKNIGEPPFIIVDEWADAIDIIKEIEYTGQYDDLLLNCKLYWNNCKLYWKDLMIRHAACLVPPSA